MINNKLNKLICCLMLILMLSVGAQAEQEEQRAEEIEKATLTSEESRYKRGENIYTAWGDVKLDYQKDLITSQNLEMKRDEDLFLFSEDVHLQREGDDEIWSQELEFNFNDDIMIARDQVRMEAYRQDRYLDLESDYLKVWLETDDLLAEDNVILFYDEQEIRGNKLEYSDEKEELVVTEEAEIKDDGDWMRSEKIVIDLEEDIIDAKDNVELEFEIR